MWTCETRKQVIHPQNTMTWGIQWCDEYYRHFGSKGRKWKERKEPLIPSNFKTAISKLQGLGPILYLFRRLCLLSHFSFSRKIALAFYWVAGLVCFLSVEFGGPDSLLSFRTLSVPFGPSWQCFCWYKILETLWVTHVCHRDSLH